MPYFKWYGLTSSNNVTNGKLFARSPDHLARLLSAHRAITLIACKPQTNWYGRGASAADKSLFFNQISTLLKAGVRISQALEIAVQTIHTPSFKIIINDCLTAVQEGVPLSQACGYHSVFEHYACQLIAAGEESGTVYESCAELAQQYTLQDELHKKIRALLIMPAVTLGFFMVVVSILFLVVIPRFTTLLQSLNKPLSSTTQRLMMISNSLKTPATLLYIIGAGIAGIFTIWALSHTKAFPWLQALYYKLPFVRSWVYYSSTYSFFKIAGTLLQRGVAIDHALYLATMSVKSISLRKQYMECTQAVKSGTPLSVALTQSSPGLSDHCIALITLGESTGVLGALLFECARYYQEKTYKLLATATQLIQPLLLMILGLLVAFLIFALYEPLFTLTDITL